MKITPNFYFYMVLVTSFILHLIYPIKQLLVFPYNLLGLIPIGLGLWFTISANEELEAFGTTQSPFSRPTTVVDCGPYRFSRNPVYFGGLLVLLGLVALMGSIMAILGVFFFYTFLMLFIIPDEEKIMEQEFGDIYLDYKKSVRRWI